MWYGGSVLLGFSLYAYRATRMAIMRNLSLLRGRNPRPVNELRVLRTAACKLLYRGRPRNVETIKIGKLECNSMGSRNRVNPLLHKPYEYPEMLDYSLERGAVYPHDRQSTNVKRTRIRRAPEVATRDWRIARFHATGERSFLYGMRVEVTKLIGPRENASLRRQRLADRTK